MERGIKDVFPQCNVVKAGVADGGEGTVEAIVKAVGGDMYAASVTDPLGRPVKAAYGIVRSGGVKTAVMEMSAASGLPAPASRRTEPVDYFYVRNRRDDF